MHLHLLSTINRAYRVPFLVTMHSLLNRLEADVTADWHICQSGLSPADRVVIEKQAAGSPARICWYSLPTLHDGSFPVRARFVPHIYARILAPDLLPQNVTRFLYLDADLLVLDTVIELWNVELKGAVIAAVQDMAVPLVSSPMGLRHFDELGCAPETPYFNAGMYVVDTAAWRRDETGRHAIDYIRRYRKSLNLLDQDALNAVLVGKWRALPLRWNLVAGLAGRRHYHPSNINPSGYEQALANPGIIHFSGRLKPWNEPRLASPWAAEYLRVLQRVAPEHALDDSLGARARSFYDRRLRRLLYPLEQRLWQWRRGF